MILGQKHRSLYCCLILSSHRGYVGIDIAAPPANEVFSGSLELMLSGDGYGTRVSAGGSGGGRVYSHSMGSDPFNLAPFIFGPRGDRRYFSRGNGVQRKRYRKPKRQVYVPPKLGKRGLREKEMMGDLPGLKRHAILISISFTNELYQLELPRGLGTSRQFGHLRDLLFIKIPW
ncbi:hypothetical protein COP2_037434 [Malus domestica]